MNKKGFTLVELLAVIVILAIIAAIAFPFIQDSIDDSKEKTYNEQVRTIEHAAKRWAADNSAELNKTTTYKSVDFLKQNGYLASNKEIIDPRDNSQMKGCVKITYDEEYKQYKYEYGRVCS